VRGGSRDVATTKDDHGQKAREDRPQGVRKTQSEARQAQGAGTEAGCAKSGREEARPQAITPRGEEAGGQEARH